MFVDLVGSLLFWFTFFWFGVSVCARARSYKHRRLHHIFPNDGIVLFFACVCASIYNKVFFCLVRVQHSCFSRSSSPLWLWLAFLSSHAYIQFTQSKRNSNARRQRRVLFHPRCLRRVSMCALWELARTHLRTCTHEHSYERKGKNLAHSLARRKHEMKSCSSKCRDSDSKLNAFTNFTHRHVRMYEHR